MKKLFLALMAVCVMASCGGDGGSGKKSPVAVVDNMIAVATTFKANIQKSYDTGNSEAFVRAFENFVSEMLDIKEKYQDVISNMTDEEKEKCIPKLDNFANLMEEIEYLSRQADYNLEFSDEQQTRVLKVTNKLGDM